MILSFWGLLIGTGAIGSIIAHEITHGFDDRGRQNDGNGEVSNWWTEEALDNYLEKSQCFVDQYSRYTVPELNNITVSSPAILENHSS